MTNLIFICLTLVLWFVMAIYWIIKASTDSQTKVSFEISSIMKLIFSAMIIYLPLLIDGWFSKPLFLPDYLSSITGVVLCGAGVLFAILGRSELGKNWSGKVMIQQTHTLIQTGPYKLSRHPQYTGAIIAYFGTSIVTGQIFGFIWTILLTLGLFWKAKLEEKILLQKFPDEYPEYKKKVRMIIPFVY